MPWLSLPFQVFYNNLYVIPIPEFSYALTYSKCLHQTWKENKNQRAVRGLFQITITFHIIQQLFGLFCKHNYKPPLLLPSPHPPPTSFWQKLLPTPDLVPISYLMIPLMEALGVSHL